MKKLVVASFTFICALVLHVGCDSLKETFEAPLLSEYFPLNVGTTTTYRLDSTVPAPFGTALLVKSYQAKDSIESTFVDNQGRVSYRIFRLIKNLAGTEPWRFASTYVATPTQTSIEYVDNNLRFLKLVSPLRNNYKFKAHSFIPVDQGGPLGYLFDWEYEYQKIGEPYTIGNKTYANTITVFQRDETAPEGPFNPALPAQIRSLGIEIYAKGIGLIYKDFLYWNWQQNPPPAKFEDASFGVKLTAMSF